MTVSELIEKLSKHDGNMKVVVPDNYDTWYENIDDVDTKEYGGEYEGADETEMCVTLVLCAGD